MNERIKELAINCAGQLEWDLPKDPESLTFSCHELEKFVNLILQECIDLANHSNVTGKSIIGERIKEHFGIKE